MMQSVEYGYNSGLYQQTHWDPINTQISNAIYANRLPRVKLLKFALESFNLYGRQSSPSQPSVAVRTKLLELANVTPFTFGAYLNFTTLSAQDVAVLFRIIKSYSNSHPYDVSFPQIVNVIQGYLVYLSSVDTENEKVENVLKTLYSFNDLIIVGELITKMTAAIETKNAKVPPAAPLPPLGEPAIRLTDPSEKDVREFNASLKKYYARSQGDHAQASSSRDHQQFYGSDDDFILPTLRPLRNNETPYLQEASELEPATERHEYQQLQFANRQLREENGRLRAQLEELQSEIENLKAINLALQ